MTWAANAVKQEGIMHDFAMADIKMKLDQDSRWEIAVAVAGGCGWYNMWLWRKSNQQSTKTQHQQ